MTESVNLAGDNINFGKEDFVSAYVLISSVKLEAKSFCKSKDHVLFHCIVVVLQEKLKRT